MEILVKIENLFQKRKNIFLIFFILICFQFFYSFLFPAYNDNPYWKTIKDLNFYQGYSFNDFDNGFIQKIYPLISHYRMNLDVGGYLLLAHDFPQHYFKGNYTLLTRPLYPILVNLVAKPLHLISSSYSLTFVAGLLVNFILFFFAVILFYLLVEKFISLRTAFISSVLLIFSPFTHVWLIQPETNIFGIFTVVLILYLLCRYLEAPSFRKLIIFSLIVGILLLGKKLFAISIFILFLSIFFRRYKEGAIFFISHLIPMSLWGWWLNKVWELPLYVDEVSSFNFGVWIFKILDWPWYKTFQIFIDSVPQFISSIIYGFLLFPVIFALLGYKKLALPKKNILTFGFFLSFFILFFGMNLYLPRYGFWTFPFIYPLSVLGIDRVAELLERHKKWYNLGFYVLIYSLIIFVSSLNIYKFVLF